MAVSEAGAPEPQADSLRMEYQEVCRSHAAIKDFRAKLLALLLVATGVGVGALTISSRGRLSDIEPGLLVALGVFGAIVTYGLFLYEVRQIDICKQLRNHGSWLEKELKIRAGQFGGRRERLSLQAIYSKKARKDRDELSDRAETSGELPESEPESCNGRGPFRKPLIGAEAAGNVVYHTVFVVWLALAVFGAFRLFLFPP
jgi:hypothetical protein